MDDGRGHNGSSKVARYIQIIFSPLLLTTDNPNRKVTHPANEPSSSNPYKPSGMANPRHNSTQVTTIIEDFINQDEGDEPQSSESDNEDGEDQLEYSSGDTGGSMVCPILYFILPRF